MQLVHLLAFTNTSKIQQKLFAKLGQFNEIGIEN